MQFHYSFVRDTCCHVLSKCVHVLGRVSWKDSGNDRTERAYKRQWNRIPRCSEMWLDDSSRSIKGKSYMRCNARLVKANISQLDLSTHKS